MRITRSSGNVYLDLGFPRPEAGNLLIRTDLMVRIERLIRRRRLTQAQAARLFGVTQPRISDLVRGKLERFSIDSLVEMLSRRWTQWNSGYMFALRLGFAEQHP